ncbi:hypothetical protein, partial [Lysinibacillus fusiformis]|uniref:hypothetical protein n=1 Tax=Lysinibacillus fusiformis TaxID=28031 RepID=UPI003CFE93D6
VIASIFCSRVIPAIKKAPPNVRVVSNIWGADHNKESVFIHGKGHIWLQDGVQELILKDKGST